VKEFHHEVLKVGYVPLDILDEVIMEWIEHKKHRYRVAHAHQNDVTPYGAGESRGRSSSSGTSGVMASRGVCVLFSVLVVAVGVRLSVAR
jgi:hypothetical protein